MENLYYSLIKNRIFNTIKITESLVSDDDIEKLTNMMMQANKTKRKTISMSFIMFKCCQLLNISMPILITKNAAKRMRYDLVWKDIAHQNNWTIYPFSLVQHTNL